MARRVMRRGRGTCGLVAVFGAEPHADGEEDEVEDDDGYCAEEAP